MALEKPSNRSVKMLAEKRYASLLEDLETRTFEISPVSALGNMNE
jgi:hypothetical protein